MKLTACAQTDVGLLRQNNEDSVYADCHNNLFMVADGMGGHRAGEVASRMAIETVRAQFPPYSSALENTAQQLKEAFVCASQHIRQEADNDPSKRGMGTTLSVLYINDNTAHLAHVGDSRIYRLRGSALEQLSTDHSLVAEQVRLGLLSAADARTSQMRNILLQAVGLEAEIEVFLLHEILLPEDLFLLCSDGLTDMLDDGQICQILQQRKTPEQIAGELIKQANTMGGRDNISVVVVKIDSELPPTV